jgi:hypothetical protein
MLDVIADEGLNEVVAVRDRSFLSRGWSIPAVYRVEIGVARPIWTSGGL